MTKRIDVPAGDEETVAMWRHLAHLAEELPGEWVLVGGLMVQLQRDPISTGSHTGSSATA